MQPQSRCRYSTLDIFPLIPSITQIWRENGGVHRYLTQRTTSPLSPLVCRLWAAVSDVAAATACSKLPRQRYEANVLALSWRCSACEQFANNTSTTASHPNPRIRAIRRYRARATPRHRISATQELKTEPKPIVATGICCHKFPGREGFSAQKNGAEGLSLIPPPQASTNDRSRLGGLGDSAGGHPRHHVSLVKLLGHRPAFGRQATAREVCCDLTRRCSMAMSCCVSCG